MVHTHRLLAEVNLTGSPLQTESSQSADLSYDSNGNRTVHTVTSSSSTESTTYQWDAFNRLTGVTVPAGTQYQYAYDYRTRRITSRNVTENETTGIVFSGGLSVAEYSISGNSSQLEVNYVRGPDMGGGVGGLLYTARPNTGSGPSEIIKYNLSNGRGDIVAQSDASAELTWTASYEAGGKRTTETGSNTDKQRANSKDEDPTGLLNEGFRYRDLHTGVWLSRDPAGFVDGPNLYTYVLQNPWTAFDPEGLFIRYLIDKFDTHVSAPIAEAIANSIPEDICVSASESKAFSAVTESAKIVHATSKGALDALVPGSGVLDAGEALVQGEGSAYDVAKAVVDDFGGKKLKIAVAAGETVASLAEGNETGALQAATEGVVGVFTKKKVGKGGPYSHLPDHPSVGPGKNFTQSQKKKFLAENEKANGGTLRDDVTGEELVRPQKHKKGVRPPDNEAHIDHVDARSKGGSNSSSNANVRSRKNNLEKSDN